VPPDEGQSFAAPIWLSGRYVVSAKVAVTDLACIIQTSRLPVPEQPPPDQPVKGRGGGRRGRQGLYRSVVIRLRAARPTADVIADRDQGRALRRSSGVLDQRLTTRQASTGELAPGGPPPYAQADADVSRLRAGESGRFRILSGVRDAALVYGARS
jgi:hypothetical protein